MINSGTIHWSIEIINDDDEVVAVLIDRLLDISEALGNPTSNIYLFPILESLIQLETTTLRDKVSKFTTLRLTTSWSKPF
jgi:hypothetical protein